MRNREYVTHAFPKTLLRATRTFHTHSLPCFLFLCSSCVRACFSKAPIRSFLLHKSQHAVVLADSGSTARLVNNGKLLTYNNLALLTINDLVKAHTHTHAHAHTISREGAEFWISFVQHWLNGACHRGILAWHEINVNQNISEDPLNKILVGNKHNICSQKQIVLSLYLRLHDSTKLSWTSAEFTDFKAEDDNFH